MISRNLSRTLIACSLLLAASAQAFTPPVPEINAKAYYLTDFQSGSELASRDANMRVEPASLTKLMTAYVVFKAVKEGRIRLDQQLTVSTKGWKTEGSRMFLDPKAPARVDDLIKGMIVQSGNDACVTLAEAIAGSEEVFAQMMNQQAQRLGMTGSHFMNSTGLPDPNHYMTVADLGKIAAAIIRDYPEFYPIYSMKEFTYNKIRQPNRNLLLYRDPNVDGMKTGHTNSAGFNLVASTHKDGRRLISVVVGTTGDEVRANESAKLLNWGTQFFDTPKVFTAKQPLATQQVYKGAESSVKVGFVNDQFVTVPKGDGSKVTTQVKLDEPLIAPIKAGQQLGTIDVLDQGKVIAQYPAQALENVEEAGFFGRLIDSIKLMFHKWFGGK
ncbi:D-alanyl-D-alanine carboxypeptidase (penicillin-binding protein 5/6) [Silvimonas terrae]|uniref:serine-type D-Ala-D-Ala carboxypeptidase n=1 Tax=Silvimonas terrae TaxID=300266 RepID=A0A840RDU7_9NEIS|nr:D-alanyl-D-alanine carboxypeptidase family protein [Silvimonas terrae]MBB5191505.1 D-alanyl-D-alanine carboxypeptidase (penicillin-binding protein 5/6) [Silvimonas terrae]